MMVGVPFGRLPGDIVDPRGQRARSTFPLVTSIVVSMILTLLLSICAVTVDWRLRLRLMTAD